MTIAKFAIINLSILVVIGHASFQAFMGYDPSIRINLNISIPCMEALNLTVECDAATANMAALGVDHNYWYLENLTSLCSPSCSKSLQTWLSQVESSCASDEINQSGILVQAKTVALQYTYYYSLACLQDSSGKWCFYESQNWVGSDYIRYDPDMCWQDPAPELCNDPDFSIDQIDAAMEAVPNLYNKTLYCSECFMKLWQQRLISPFLPVSNHTKFLMEQFEYMQGNCSKSMPYSTSPSTLFVSIAPTPTEVSNSTGSSITPTCTGQLASPEPTPIGCNQLADRYNVSTGDLRIATGDFFCEIHQTVCLPAPCSLAIIDSYGKTCDGYASQLSNSTLNVTSAMFFGWNQNIQGSCDDLSIDQRICIGPPGGSWVVNGSVYAPTGTSAYHTTAKPATPTQTGTIPDCGLYYEAVSGDTCQQICLRFGISFDQFRKLNTYINDNCTNLWLRYSVCIAEVSLDPQSTNGLCGPNHDFATCNGTTFGVCCSIFGFCGGGEEYCSPGNCFSGACIGSGSGVTTNGTCGPGITCNNVRFGPCCSIYGYCGEGEKFCGPGNCYSGACDPDNGGLSINGECGPLFAGNKTCTGTQFGKCCSTDGYCGNTDEYCKGSKCYSGACSS